MCQALSPHQDFYTQINVTKVLYMRLYCKLRVHGVYMHPKRSHMYANDPTVHVRVQWIKETPQ